MRAVGRVREIVRYPVKSMAGLATESAHLGWHGIDGDRRLAFRCAGDERDFPWLSASTLPMLVCYRPDGLDESGREPLPSHVATPSGARVALRSPELRAEIAARLGRPVELMWLKHGTFDEAAVSVIGMATIDAIGREAGFALDRRRFRANVVLETESSEAFCEDGWVGGTLVFGEGEARPAVNVTMRDLRCMMVNLDPDTGKQDARVMKTVVRLNDNYAGVYATVVRAGTIRVGDRVDLAIA